MPIKQVPLSVLKRRLLKGKYGGIVSSKFNDDCKRIQKGEPIEYIIGSEKFCGCSMDLSYRPFIPSPHTEWWVKRAAKRIAKETVPLCVLDIFSGSGCIGIALLKTYPKQIAHLDFAEKYKDFCNQIGLNCRKNKISSSKYTIIQSNIFKKVVKTYDYIFAVPPYVSKINIRFVSKSALTYQPKAALLGGSDGLFYIRVFLKQAGKYLTKKGIIFMEYEPRQRSAVDILIKRFGYTKHIFHKDMFGMYGWVEIHL